MESSFVTTAPDAQARRNAKGLAGWAKFMGIITIIGGGLQAISVVGLLIAWLPIWMGVVLVRAGSKAGEYADKGDSASLEGLTGQLKTYFTISGIMMIVSFAVMLIGGIISAILIAGGMLSSDSLMDMFRR